MPTACAPPTSLTISSPTMTHLLVSSFKYHALAQCPNCIFQYGTGLLSCPLPVPHLYNWWYCRRPWHICWPTQSSIIQSGPGLSCPLPVPHLYNWWYCCRQWHICWPIFSCHSSVSYLYFPVWTWTPIMPTACAPPYNWWYCCRPWHICWPIFSNHSSVSCLYFSVRTWTSIMPSASVPHLYNWRYPLPVPHLITDDTVASHDTFVGQYIQTIALCPAYISQSGPGYLSCPPPVPHLYNWRYRLWSWHICWPIHSYHSSVSYLYFPVWTWTPIMPTACAPTISLTISSPTMTHLLVYTVKYHTSLDLDSYHAHCQCPTFITDDIVAGHDTFVGLYIHTIALCPTCISQSGPGHLHALCLCPTFITDVIIPDHDTFVGLYIHTIAHCPTCISQSRPGLLSCPLLVPHLYNWHYHPRPGHTCWPIQSSIIPVWTWTPIMPTSCAHLHNWWYCRRPWHICWPINSYHSSVSYLYFPVRTWTPIMPTACAPPISLTISSPTMTHLLAGTPMSSMTVS